MIMCAPSIPDDAQHSPSAAAAEHKWQINQSYAYTETSSEELLLFPVATISLPWIIILSFDQCDTLHSA